MKTGSWKSVTCQEDAFEFSQLRVPLLLRSDPAGAGLGYAGCEKLSEDYKLKHVQVTRPEMMSPDMTLLFMAHWGCRR